MSIIVFFELGCILLNLINCQTIIKCSSEKPKSPGVCALKRKSENSKYYKTEWIIFSKCEKNKYCLQYDDSLYSCQEGIKYRLKDEKCIYDEECIDGFCKSNYCTDRCDGHCEKGQKCEEDGDNYLCKDISLPGEECGYIPGSKYENTCSFFSIILNDYMVEVGSNCLNNKCVEIGSLKDGAYCGYQGGLLCNSGIEFEDTCISLEEEQEMYCNQKSISVRANGFDEVIECDCVLNFLGNKVPELDFGKTFLFQKLMEEYEKINKKSYKNDDKHVLKFKEYLILYEYYDLFLVEGIITIKGKVEKEKKCEYDFIMKMLSSSYSPKLNLIIFILFFLLLF